MIIVVTGASACGKSKIAEEQALKLHCSGENRKKGKLVYIATMRVYGEEERKRIIKHRKMRKGKGFITREQYTSVQLLNGENNTYLLECMSNLLANELFNENKDETDIIQNIIGQIKLISKNNHMVIVTNEVFSDGINYDIECKDYLRKLGTINVLLSEMADLVIESVVGIPVIIKEKK